MGSECSQLATLQLQQYLVDHGQSCTAVSRAVVKTVTECCGLSLTERSIKPPCCMETTRAINAARGNQCVPAWPAALGFHLPQLWMLGGHLQQPQARTVRGPLAQDMCAGGEIHQPPELAAEAEATELAVDLAVTPTRADLTSWGWAQPKGTQAMPVSSAGWKPRTHTR